MLAEVAEPGRHFLAHKLGIPVSVVINSLYRQIIYRHGIPFSLTVPSEPRTLDAEADLYEIKNYRGLLFICRRARGVSSRDTNDKNS
ncbi:type II toxin-antitoxin system RelB/DinJ family antitoxin [Clostridium vitabionis]|uniref:type II toxin-antitoxin system RelB/DinJ family antitoxin n=1 Tax=Clostridium vitabionis TaxID=2784388 RepID=UPI00188A23A2|nr:type II toxin-antitoxin system RelB/DinJ family antitoxin [Clostridium vitabionis]